MKNYKLYNVLFPFWLLIFLPPLWLFIIPGNFIIDSAVLLVSAYFVARGKVKEIWKKSILRIFIFGFLSDFVGAGFLFLGLLYDGVTDDSVIGRAFRETANGPESIAGFFLLLFAVALSGFCIYFADRKWAFKKLDLTDDQKKKLALIMAVATAPYTFFVPLY